MTINTDMPTANQAWVDDEELNALLTLLGGAVAGMPDAQAGEPIGEWGVGSNCAASFVNETFALRDFCWCEGSAHPETNWDDDEHTRMPPSGGTSDTCPMNFEHFGSGIKGIWYKHLGRDNEFNREAEPGETLRIRHECLASIEQNKIERTDQMLLDQIHLEQLRRARDEICDKIDQIDDEDPRFDELHREADSLLDQIQALT